MELTGLSSKHFERLVKLADLVTSGHRSFKAPSRLAFHARQGRRLTADERALVVMQYQAGTSMEHIALKLQVRRSTVSQVLQKAGVPRRAQRVLGPVELETAIQLYNEGHSLKYIGELLRFDAETIRTHLRRNGVKLRKPWQ